MQFILDNLLATMIAGVVFLILAVTSMRSQTATFDAANHYAFKNQELNFIDLLKRDLHGISRVTSVRENPTDSTFTFFAQLSTSDTTKYQITYRRKKVGERDGVPHYQILRFERDQPAGASMVTLTSWEIVARNQQGGPIQNPQDAAQVYVRFEAAAPFMEDDSVRRTKWEATFHPPLLRQKVLL